MARDGDGLHVRKGYWQFRYRTPDGKYPYKNTGMRAERKAKKAPADAVAFRAEFLSQLSFSGNLSAKNWTIRRASEEYVADLKGRERVSADTSKCYADWLIQVNRLMGPTKLTDVSVGTWEWYQRKRKSEGVSNRTINRELQELSKLLKRAKLWRQLEDEFDARQERAWLPVPKESPRTALSPGEFRRLVKVALGNREWTVTLCAELLAWAAGVRSKEIKTLQRRAIHLHADQCWPDCGAWSGAHIRIVRRIKATGETATKTAAGKRMLPLNLVGEWAIRKLLDRATALGSVESEHYLLPTNLARYTKPSSPLYVRRFEGYDPTIHQESWQTSWKSLRKSAGLSHVHFHDLRHTFKTLLRRFGGADLKLAMTLMGHMDAEMVRYYEHPETQEATEAVQKVADSDPQLLELLGIAKGKAAIQ